jgi:hypothetical protein
MHAHTLRPWLAGFVLAAAITLSPQPGWTQEPAARAEDVATIDAILDALYDVISGPVGVERDWDRMRSLFVPGARLVPTGRTPDGAYQHAVLSVEDYITRAGPQLERLGFREHEIARVLERFGNIAHVFSTYEGFVESSPEPFVRGINSIQLWNDGTRWWIITIFWEPENPDNPLPPRYLPGG